MAAWAPWHEIISRVLAAPEPVRVHKGGNGATSGGNHIWGPCRCTHRRVCFAPVAPVLIPLYTRIHPDDGATCRNRLPGVVPAARRLLTSERSEEQACSNRNSTPACRLVAEREPVLPYHTEHKLPSTSAAGACRTLCRSHRQMTNCSHHPGCSGVQRGSSSSAWDLDSPVRHGTLDRPR